MGSCYPVELHRDHLLHGLARTWASFHVPNRLRESDLAANVFEELRLSLAAQRSRDAAKACDRAIFRVAIFLASIFACVLASTWSVATHFDVNPIAHQPKILWGLLAAMGVATYALLHRHFAGYANKPEAAIGHDTFRHLLWLFAETAAIAGAIASVAVVSQF